MNRTQHAPATIEEGEDLEVVAGLLEHLPATLLPQHGGTATSVVVLIGLDQLTTGPDGLGAATLASGEPISAGETRRLACTANLIPAVLGTNSEVLDLGRTTRLFTRAQRTAMTIRDRRCRGHGCQIPAAWCEAHHLDPWAHGGHTDHHRGLLLCTHHHHRAHDPHYTSDRLPNGDLRFTRRT